MNKKIYLMTRLFTDVKLSAGSTGVLGSFLLFFMGISAYGQTGFANVTISTNTTSGGSWSPATLNTSAGAIVTYSFIPTSASANVSITDLQDRMGFINSSAAEVAAGNVLITTACGSCNGVGNIVVSSALNLSHYINTGGNGLAPQAAYLLTLNANGNISVNGAITLSGQLAGNAEAGRDGHSLNLTANGNIVISSGASISSNGQNGGGGPGSNKSGGKGGNITMTAGSLGYVVIAGAITTNGGTGFSASGGTGGDGGAISITGPRGVSLSANLTTNGGNANNSTLAKGIGGNITINDGAMAITSGGGSNDGQTGGTISAADAAVGTGGGTGCRFTKSGNGIFMLRQLNTYQGTTSIDAGILRASTNNVISSTNGPFGNNASGLYLNGGSIQSDVATFSRPITVLATNSGLDAYGVARTISSAITLSASGAANLNIGATTVAGGAGQNLTLTGNISSTTGTLSIIKTGTSILNLPGQTTAVDNLTINSGTLNLTSDFTNTGIFKIRPSGAVSLYGDFINNGSLVDSGQVITLAGTLSQQLGGSSLSTFKNLTLNNPAGCYLSSNQAITGVLTITSGTFTTTGFDFTLISDIYGTASIAPITGGFAGNITMQRYLGAGVSDWRFLASPVHNATINDWQDNFITSGFTGASYPTYNFVSVYTYDETVGGTCDNGYIGAGSAADQLTPGTGFCCYIGPVPLTVDVTGPPVTFNHTFSVAYTPSAGSADDGYVLVGNPYPSAIDWSSGAWTKTNINDAVYTWNPALQQYASWISGVSVNGGSNLIASSQSFWIQSNGANPFLSCTENIKVSSDPAFLRPSATPTYTHIKLSLTGNAYKDETILRFGNGATNGFDVDKDAWKWYSSNTQVPGIATVDPNQKELSVNSLPPVSSAIHVPVRTVVGVTGNYTISLDSVSDMSAGFCLVLEDLETGIQTNLNSNANYAFNISDTAVGVRFLLHMTAPHHAEAYDASCSQLQDGKAIAAGNGTGPWNYHWFNNANPNLKQTSGCGTSDTLTNLGAGVYSVHITDAGNAACGAYTHTVLVGQPLPVVADFVNDRDTVMTGIPDSLLVLNTSTGADSYLWDFGDGSPADSAFSPAPHYYNLPGTFNLRLIARFNNCSDTLIRQITVLPPDIIGLAKTGAKTGISVFPNPGEGIFNFKINSGMEHTELKIYSVTGSIAYQTPLTNSHNIINVEHLPKGVYFYRVTSEGNYVFNGKLIVE